MSKKYWDKPEALNLWKAGKSDAKIADAVGVSIETIYQWRKKNGLKANYGQKSASEQPPKETEPNPSPPEAPEPGPPPETPAPPHVIAAPNGNDRSGRLAATSGPVELHVELQGGWARLQAPSWEQAAKLWQMLNVCVAALDEYAKK